jgi:hypothetical protein
MVVLSGYPRRTFGRELRSARIERADRLDNKIGQGDKDDPRTWHRGPSPMLTEQHRKQAEPGSGRKQ